MKPRSDAILERLTLLHPKIIDLSLGRVETLLARLGHPERRLPPVVHVAGTNGKGSVIAYLRAMLEASGKRVHVYTSPHLVRFHERIRLCGRLIEEARLADLLSYCERVNGSDPITFFEITTAAAFQAFTEEPADVLLLETGLGGRLDATNVIERPALAVITPISIDHVQYLGETLEKIAFEKAGILKPGVTAVIAPQPSVAETVLERRATEAGAWLFRAGEEWRFSQSESGIAYDDPRGALVLPPPILPGTHQIENAATAVAAARELPGFNLDATAIAAGLLKADWPGRLQHLKRGRLAELLPAGWELWLDGGHNPSAGEALAKVLSSWQGRPIKLVFGMLNTKAACDFLRPLVSIAEDIHAVAIPGEANSLSAEAAAAQARAVGARATPAASVSEALSMIAAKGGPPARILVCGSLYLAGRVLAENEA